MSKESKIESLLKTRGITFQSTSILDKCVFLCEHHSITPEELVDQLDAFLINYESHFSLEVLGKFEQHVRQNMLKASVKSSGQRSQTASSYASTAMPAIKFSAPKKASTSVSGADTAISATQDYSQSQSQSQGDGSVGAFRQRPNRGQTVLEMNSVLGKRPGFTRSQSQPVGARCKVSQDDADFENIKGRYRFMYTNLDERARAFDRHLATLQEAMCASISLPLEDVQPVGIPNQSPVWVCGRICSETAVGKFSKAAVILEGARKDSGGRRVALEFDDLRYSLFPGQIVLAYGVNSTGRKMTVSRIVCGQSCPLPQSSPSKLIEFHHSKLFQGGLPLHVQVCAGPFTTSDNLRYEPLMEVLTQAMVTKPDVLILIGPFVDSTQPLLSAGDVVIDEYDDADTVTGHHSASYEMIFVEKIIRDGLSSLFNTDEDEVVPTNIVLVPSLLDAHHEFVFPQPPFGDRDTVRASFFEEDLGVLNVPFSKDKDPMKRVHLLPNPCMFRINEVLFGVTSQDVTLSLSADEISHEPAEPHRITRLLSHLLQQQSFFPQCPAPASVAAQLDMRQARHWTMKTSPDVLIAPSKLTQIVKDVDGTLVINPGMVTKGTTGGSYADLSIHPLKEDSLRNAIIAKQEHMPHKVPERTCATIIKI